MDRHTLLIIFSCLLVESSKKCLLLEIYIISNYFITLTKTHLALKVCQSLF